MKMSKPEPKTEPSALQHPKYNARSILQCPHDMKDSSEAWDKIAKIKANADPSIKATSSALFQSSSSDSSNLMVKANPSPMVTIFAELKKSDDSASAAKRKAQAIRAGIQSPMEKYLPNAGPSSLAFPTSVNAEPTPKWRLLPPTEKPKPKQKKIKVTLPQPKTDDITMGEGDAIPLRQGAPVKTKKRKQRQELMPVDSSEVAGSVATTLAELRKQMENSPAMKKAKSDSGEEEEEAMEEQEAEKKKEFTPHVYSKEAMNMFKGLKKDKKEKKGKKDKSGKRGDYNPEEQDADGEIKGVNRMKSKKSSNKSHSYTKGSQAFPKMNWPKR